MSPRGDFLQLHCRPKTPPSAFASIKSSNLTSLASLSQNPTSAAFVPGNLPDYLRSVRSHNYSCGRAQVPWNICISLRNGALTGSCWYGLVIPVLDRTVRGLVALPPSTLGTSFAPRQYGRIRATTTPQFLGKPWFINLYHH